jgi:hypothetical protein
MIGQWIQQGLGVLQDVSAYWSQVSLSCLSLLGLRLNKWGRHQVVYRRLLRHESLEQHYTRLRQSATTLEQYHAACKALDKLQGKDSWKEDPQSPLFDHALLQERIRLLKKARDTDELGNIIFLLRTSLSRNIGDMGNPKVGAWVSMHSS